MEPETQIKFEWIGQLSIQFPKVTKLPFNRISRLCADFLLSETNDFQHFNTITPFPLNAPLIHDSPSRMHQKIHRFFHSRLYYYITTETASLGEITIAFHRVFHFFFQ